MRKTFLRRLLILFLLTLPFYLSFPEYAEAAPRLQDSGARTVIVIDPGHGGENRGTIAGEHEEKLMTMTTALAMYEELLLYDNVEVYLTRSEDTDITLADRAEFAKSVEADFLFSIHYNASENHELYGSEVWVSSLSPYNGYGYQFGYEFLSEMKEWGLLVRGVKTRLGTKGDYYGIIRESVNRDIPAVIIEHCHVDEAHDAGFCDSDEKLKEFGRADALAVAKYFGLKSAVLGTDYSGYQLAEPAAGTKATLADSTEPDICQIEFQDADVQNGSLSLTVSGADYDTALLYYSYSLDGGRTYSSREPWPESDALTGEYADTFTLNLSVPPGTKPEVILRAYNMYDLYRESNCWVSEQIFPSTPPREAISTEKPVSEELTVIPVGGNTVEENPGTFLFLLYCLAGALGLLLFMFLFGYLSLRRRRKRRLQRRKEAGSIWNQQK